ncbi:DUF308 domain-containing protein [Candidatus Hodarchaeum mangrovi]
MQLTVEIPIWLRIYNIAVGLVFLFLSIFVITNIELAISSLILILSIIVIFAGLSRSINGLFDQHLTRPTRIFNMLIGGFGIVLGVCILLFQVLGEQFLIFLLALSLLTQGLARILVSLTDFLIPRWFRFILILFGGVSIFISILVILFPELGIVTLIFLLAIGFISSGIGRMITGFSCYVVRQT